jgi:hypothetical protein
VLIEGLFLWFPNSETKLGNGIAFRDLRSLPNPESNCPLLDMRALELSGLKVMMDFAGKTVSV